MHLTTFGGIAASLALVTLGSISPGCGGGGGGKAPNPCDPASATPVPIALQGDVAPGTLSGAFGTFPAETVADVAQGGWMVFVADVVGDLTVTRGVFAATPNGTVVDVYRNDQLAPAPAPAATQLDDFDRVWVTKSGRVVVLAETPSSGRAFLTAQVSTAGVVTARTTAFYTGEALPLGLGPAALQPGFLAAVDEDLVAVDDDADIFFVGTGTTNVHGLWTVRADASSPVAIGVEGDTVPVGATGKFGASWTGLGVDHDGGLAAYAASIVNGSAADGIFASNAGGQRVTVEVEGDTAPGPWSRTFATAFDGGPLVVSVSGTTSFVAWRANLSGTSPSRAVFWRRTGPTMGATTLVAGPGLPPPGVSPGLFGDVALMDSKNDPGVVCLLAPVTGNVLVQKALYRVLMSDTPATERVLSDHDLAPGSTARFTDVFPSVVEDRVAEVSEDDSVVFTAQLDDFSTAVWLAPGACASHFAIAVAGQLVPDDPHLGVGLPGGTYASFATPSFVTAARGVIAFRAGIVGGTSDSGLFRRM